MMQAAGVERIHQRFQHMFLSDRVREGFWPPFPGQNEIAHTVTKRRRPSPTKVSQCNAPTSRRKGQTAADLRIETGEVARASESPAPGVTATAAPFRA